MSNPKERQREHDEPDELELEAETVKDLDVEEQSAEEVRGGPCWNSYGSNHPG